MEEKRPVSNYQRQCDEWAQKFLQMDIGELCRRLPGLKIENNELTLMHFDRLCGVSLETGKIRAMDGEALSVGETFNIYTLFAYVKLGAALSGEWLPFAELKNASVFAPAFKRGTLDTFARMFSGRVDELMKGCEAIGGVKLAVGDAAYELKAFECIPIRVIFWDADEEFDAQANILFDRSATDFIHVESTVTIADAGIMRIAKAAGIDGEAGFQMK